MDEEDSSMFDRIKDLPMLKSSQLHSSLRLDEENPGGQPPVSLRVHNSVSLTGGASASRDITPKRAFILQFNLSTLSRNLKFFRYSLYM